MEPQLAIITALGLVSLGLGAVLLVRSRGEKGRAQQAMEEARREAGRLKAEAEVAAKGEALKLREGFEDEVRKAGAEAEEARARSARRDEELERRL